MKKLLTTTMAIATALSLAAPASADDPPPAHSFSGHMIAGGQVSEAHLVDNDGGSLMTASNGCTQEWHMDQVMQSDTDVRRAFASSHVTAGQGPNCHDSRTLGINVSPPDSPYGMHNGKWNMNVIDQDAGNVSWVMDSDS
jgi:hypothetical protein